MLIYLTKNGRQDGPHTLDHINAEARAGRLQPSDLAWVEGWPAWQTVSNVPGFIGLPSPPPLSPPFPPPLAVPPPGESEKADLLRTFVGPNYQYYSRKWVKAEQKSKKNTWNWAAFFLYPWWAAYRKMYGYASLCLAVIALAAICDFALGLNASISNCIGLALALAFGLNGNRWYRLRAEQRIKQIAPAGAADEATRSRVAQAGGTSGWAVFLFIIAFIVVIGGVGMIEAAVSAGGKGGSPSGAWSLSNYKDKDDPEKTWHSLRIDNGTQDGLNLTIDIRSFSQGIQPVQGIYLIAVTNIPITDLTFRRQSETEVQQPDANFTENHGSRVLVQIKPLDVMTSDELSKQFGVQALISLGAQLFDQHGSLDKAAAMYKRVILDYYNTVFSGEPLLVEISFTDLQGKGHTVLRTIDCSEVAAKRGEYLSSCGLKDPYK